MFPYMFCDKKGKRRPLAISKMIAADRSVFSNSSSSLVLWAKPVFHLSWPDLPGLLLQLLELRSLLVGQLDVGWQIRSEREHRRRLLLLLFLSTTAVSADRPDRRRFLRPRRHQNLVQVLLPLFKELLDLLGFGGLLVQLEFRFDVGVADRPHLVWQVPLVGTQYRTIKRRRPDPGSLRSGGRHDDVCSENNVKNAPAL